MEKLIPIWAGVECTVNRVGDRFHHQCLKNGHSERLQDLQQFATLGIERIRYPFLWEIACEKCPVGFDWTWADTRIQELKSVGLTPIAGLVHHGSGPSHTNLMDPEFPEKLAHYAKAFAQRYPDITDYTPVNEPLTTARFSGLYGVWYPHEKSDASFLRCLYNEVKATILSMREIRKVNPQARLIQTEDFGRAQSTEPLRYQVEFENQRRWLTFDLLTGRMNPDHPIYYYLISNGLSPEELQWLTDNPCPPDIIGINTYLLSNRFLDHRLELYPKSFHGGNGRDQYADVGIIDTTAGEIPSPESLLKEVWERYQLPIAITEIHLLGTRENQMRWFHQVTAAAQKVKDEDGVDMRAVTAWSLLGAFDWNSLCTDNRNFYESGVYDIRSPQPRPTALAKMVRSWALQKPYEHPVLMEPGWWKLRDRAPFGPKMEPRPIGRNPKTKPLLITGANGTLGRAFARICETRNIPFRALTRQEMEISDYRSVQSAIEQLQPWAVINAAGYVRVDEAETDKDKCFRENVLGPRNIAQVTSQKRIPLVHFSSDLVFDGKSSDPYVESSEVAPLNFYGHTKAHSERVVLETHPESLVIRTSSFFGPWDEFNFVFSVLKSMAEGNEVIAASDTVISPTYVPDLVDITLDLLIDGEKGILHLTNRGHLTWAGLAAVTSEMALERRIASHKSWSPEKIISRSTDELGLAAPRPLFSAMNSERVQILPNYEEALHRYFNELEIALLTTRKASMEMQL